MHAHLHTRVASESRGFDGTARPVEALALEIVNLLLVGLLLITRSVVGSFCELLEVMLYEDK